MGAPTGAPVPGSALTSDKKSSDNTLRRLLSGSVVSIDEIRGKTPQSGCETKRITSKKLRMDFKRSLRLLKA